MKVSSGIFLALPLAITAAAVEQREAKVTYDGYKVFHVNAKENFDAVEAAISKLNTVSLSCEDRHDHLDVAVAPEDVASFLALGFDSKLVEEDLGASIQLEGELESYTATTKMSRVQGGDVVPAELPDMSWFDSYHVFEDHLQWLEDVQAAFPDNSEIFVAGQSEEGRPIQGIHLWGRDGPGIHEAIIWHGTVHAREWIVAPTVEYMAYKLVDGYKKRACSSVRTLDNYDMYIMPVVNPDGFVYTHSVDRLWRKNRQARVNQTCVGTDVNRNWPYKWDVPGGSSPNPCSQTYRGEAPGDTIENSVLQNHTLTLAQTTGVKLYIDWHAYSQLILLPYGYSCDAVADNNDYQMGLATGVANAIKGVNGLEFIYGPTCPTIYQTSGVSMDYVYDIAKADLAWGVELRPSSGAGGGFVLPASQIRPSGEEIWTGMKWLLANM